MTQALRPPPDPSAARRPPPLQPGDRLSRAEFERRYAAMPRRVKAELIEGHVYIAGPVRYEHHGRGDRLVAGWLFTYERFTPGVEGGGNVTCRLDMENEPQPDQLLFVSRDCGGQVRVTEDGPLEGELDLVVEVAGSSVSIDLHRKLRIYQRNAVREYVVWRTEDRAIDWFVSRDGVFQPLAPSDDGLFRSEAFPGLWLDPVALIERRLTGVAEAVERGCRSPEHAAFVARLAAAKIA